MRILLANSYYAPDFAGGAERVLHNLAEGFARRGATVAAFTTGETEVVDKINGITVHRFPIQNTFRKFNHELPGKLHRGIWQVRDLWSPLMAKRFEHVVEAFQPDIVHFHNIAGLTRSIWPIPRARGIPSVQVLHDLHLVCPTSSMFKNERSCVQRCAECSVFRYGFAKASRDISAVVGVSRFVLDRVTSYGLFSGCEQQVIYNSTDQISPSALIGGAHLRFGFIGALAPYKGIEWLIDQFDNSMGELLVAGSGSAPYVDRLKALAAGKAITFLGYQPSAEFFPRIDVGLVPSLWNDTLPGAAIEAGAHGRPVIASRNGGIPEIIRDGVSGLLIDANEPNSLGDAMRTLAQDRAQVERMAAAAPAIVAKFLDFDRVIDEYESLHEKLIANQRLPFANSLTG